MSDSACGPDTSSARLRLAVLAPEFSVCKFAAMPEELLERGFCFVVRTDEELSVVCETARVGEGTLAREDGWRAFKVCGPLDFGLVGILAKISAALADAGVPLFAVSTYDTDYILVKAEKLDTAIIALRAQGCDVVA